MIRKVSFAAASALTLSMGVACGGAGESVGDESASAISTCGFTVTTNTYDGPEYWGTITIKNGGAAVTGFSVKLDVPSGTSCTSDAVPSGATLSTSGDVCTFKWASKSIASGASYTFNYSTDSTSFTKATNVTVTSSSCGSTGSADAGVDSGHDAAAPDAATTPDAASTPDSSTGAGLFANCSLTGGCIADCSPPANDPIATGNADFDLYDGCILAAMKVAGMTETWQGQLLKSQAYNESGISPVISTNDDACGGQNCGIWAISAGSVSGDDPPGPCGSSATDPLTGQVDYSHSYGLFQDTPACEGTFLRSTIPSGYTCTPTTKVNNIPFNTDITFYCESATSLGVSTPSGTKKGYINAVQKTTDPLYATSIFNPAYQLYVYMDYTWAINFQQANAGASGCTEVEQWYLSLAYWLTGNATSSCTLTGDGLSYVKTAISDYETVLYNKTWPYPAP